MDKSKQESVNGLGPNEINTTRLFSLNSKHLEVRSVSVFF